MEPSTDNPPLIVIVGPTASGKTSLAVELALRFNGEIVCADSRTVYKGMNIGTAKPSAEERQKVPHHLLDITTPDKPLTVVDFKKYSNRAIADISHRGKVPFLVGGTGLYIDAVVFDFVFRTPPNPEVRRNLLNLSVDDLRKIIFDTGLSLPQNAYNPRHLIRQIETQGAASKKSELRPNTLLLGLMPDKDELVQHISERLDLMLDRGLELEVRKLVEQYGWECRALQTIGYQEFRPYFENEQGLPEVKAAILRHSLQYAKRQKTWFARNKHIMYIRKVEESVDLITTFLNKSYIVE